MPSPDELLIQLPQHTSEAQRNAISGGRDHLVRMLKDLCSSDVKAYAWGTDEESVSLMLVGAKDHGVLDVSVSGTEQEPVCTMELLPVRPTPMHVQVTDLWGPGALGERPRERRWTFDWEGEPARRRAISYPLEDGAARSESRAWETSALKLADMAGWPVP